MGGRCNSKKLKRVSGELHVAPVYLDLDRPPTAGSPLKRCGKDINLNSISQEDDICPERKETVEYKQNEQAVVVMTALNDSTAVDQEVTAEEEVKAEEVDLKWNSDTSSATNSRPPEAAATTPAATSKTLSGSGSGSDKYPYPNSVSKQSSKVKENPAPLCCPPPAANAFLTSEKGAIRFHLPGRIQHKTTIKVAHFPVSEEKNITLNVKPESCDGEAEEEVNLPQNFIMPPPPPEPSYGYPPPGGYQAAYPYPPYGYPQAPPQPYYYGYPPYY